MQYIHNHKIIFVCIIFIICILKSKFWVIWKEIALIPMNPSKVLRSKENVFFLTFILVFRYFFWFWITVKPIRRSQSRVLQYFIIYYMRSKSFFDQFILKICVGFKNIEVKNHLSEIRAVYIIADIWPLI